MTEPSPPPPLTDEQLSELSKLVPPLRHLGRVGLLGGSFNPPHIGHLLMAAAVYATEEIDHLWVIPTADHAFGKKLAPFVERARMCHVAFRHLAGGAAVLDLEARLPRAPGTPSYTVDTLRALHAIRPGIKPVWIAGSDIIADLPRWKEPQEVQRLCRLVIVPRRGYPADGLRLQVDLPLLSSTEIRDLIAEGKDVSGMVDYQVLRFIEERGLYRR
ncbi:MAG: nicotinate (nicotinamide) nucleotide adenylyltransferase [Deltaproteobacteria bacterium]|nr:nicotinate (nicotinamide) nucleotide adenylyltransferase [Deltaproteobacteria bacterium]